MNSYTRRRFLTDLLCAGGAIAFVAGVASTGTTQASPSGSPTPNKPNFPPPPGGIQAPPVTPSPLPQRLPGKVAAPPHPPRTAGKPSVHPPRQITKPGKPAVNPRPKE